MTAKVCRHCGIEKPAASFPVNVKMREGLDSWCRECHRQAVREWSAKHYVPRVRQPRPISTRVIKPKVVRQADCPMCKVSFVVSREHLNYCSDECATQSRRARGRLHPNPSRAQPRNIQECQQCFKLFPGTPGRHFCSDQCGRVYHRRMDRDKRRAIRADRPAGRIFRNSIFVRDGWICGICSMPVDRTADANTPEGPTLDHIVPLAKGGEHVMSNVQLAHRVCNMRKSTSVQSSLARIASKASQVTIDPNLIAHLDESVRRIRRALGQ